MPRSICWFGARSRARTRGCASISSISRARTLRVARGRRVVQLPGHDDRGRGLAAGVSRRRLRPAACHRPWRAGAGARQFLFVSAMGADAHSSVFYSRVKGELENAAAALGFAATIAFRPSLLAGERAEYRFGERVALAVLRPAAMDRCRANTGRLPTSPSRARWSRTPSAASPDSTSSRPTKSRRSRPASATIALAGLLPPAGADRAAVPARACWATRCRTGAAGRARASDALTRFVFSVAIPAFLFRLMSDFSRLPPVDARLLIAYFGGCLVVFALGRVIAATLFRLDGAVAIGIRHGRHLRQHRAARHSAGEGHAGRRVDALRVARDRLQFAAAVDARDGFRRMGAPSRVVDARLRPDDAGGRHQSRRRRHPAWHRVRLHRLARFPA